MTQIKFSSILLFTVLWLAATGMPAFAEDDLFDFRKSDTAIKPFVFPKSMTVIRDCYPDEGGCIFLNPEPGMGGIDKAIVANLRCIKEALNNEKAIKKYLVRLDPARIAPSTRGKDYKAGSISNELDLSKRILKELGKQFDVDFIFVFRRTIFHTKRPRFIRTEGRIYLVRQNKLLIVPSNDQILELDTLDLKKKMKATNQTGLQQLAKDARKVIHSHKFEKRRSNY